MKKTIYFIFALLSFSVLKAQDTIKVNTHNQVVIKTNPAVGQTFYPAWGSFPKSDVAYRKVYMTLEFGCAPGLKCGEWDYNNHIYIGKKGGVNGDSLNYELARFITPYGFYWNSSQNWKHAWVFDITDFSELLHDSVLIIYKHSGYEANNDRGWTVKLDFNFVKGEPARIPAGYFKFYEVSAPYGKVNNPFKNNVPDMNFQVPADANRVNFKIIQTGHGMDQKENCSEFCSKTRTIKLDNNIISEKNVWRDNCGFNSLYPQAGTWLYDRAGWCPGAPVIPDDIYQNITGGSQHNFSLNMQDYTNDVGGDANFYISAYAFFFKDNQKQNDVSLESIIAPSTEYESARYNPICGVPIIKVKNMGTETVTSIDFEYGKVGGEIQKSWVPCNIKPFETQILTIESIYNWRGAGNDFFVNIVKVNSKADEYPKDNMAYSKIPNSETLPSAIVIEFRTNNAPTENYYTLKDNRGVVIRSKNNFAANTTYRDTVYLGNNICYSFEFFDDGPAPANNRLNKDGLGWWANTSDGTGLLRIRNLNGNSVLKNFAPDFGTKIIYNFHTTYSMDIDEQAISKPQLLVYPNPGKDVVYVDFTSSDKGNYELQIVDITGKKVYEKTMSEPVASLGVDHLPNGIYNVVIVQNQTVLTKTIIIQH